jgi:hypothetical protein
MSNISEVLGTLPGASTGGGEAVGGEVDAPTDEDEEEEEAGAPDGDVRDVDGDAATGTATQSRSVRFLARFRRLNHALCELVQDYALVSFTPLAVTVRACGGMSMGVVFLHAPPNPLPFPSPPPQTPPWTRRVQDKESMAKLLEVIDRSNGFVALTKHTHRH